MSIYLDNHFNYNNERVIDRNKKQLKKNSKAYTAMKRPDAEVTSPGMKRKKDR